MPDNKPSQEEIDRIIRMWNKKHPKYSGMLEAQPYELDEDSDWYWSQTDRQYISKSDTKVPWAVVGGLIAALLVGNKLEAPAYGGLATYGQLAEGLKSGVLSVEDWKAGMQSLITLGQQTSIIASNGGVEFMTNADWTYTQQQIEKQFAFLEGFAKDIISDPEKWMNGRLDNRMRLYQESANAAFQNSLTREAKLSGMDEEQWVLGAADHCPGCLEQASLGWVPIGTLDEIGSEECSQNCHCSKEYRKAEAGETPVDTAPVEPVPTAEQSKVLDLSGVKSYEDLHTEFSAAVDAEKYDIDIQNQKFTDLNKVSFRGTNIYFQEASQAGAEDITLQMETFRRNNGDSIYNKMFGNTNDIVVTDREWKMNNGWNAAATAGNNSMVVYNNGAQFGYEELIHETAHVATDFDYYKFKEAFTKFTENGELPPTEYGNMNIAEDIAESVREYFMNQEKMQMHYDQRNNFIRSWLNE